MLKKFRPLGVAGLIGLMLSGCAALGIGDDHYACPGGAEGVRCMSARQVYAATEHSDYVKPTVNEEDSSVAKSGVPASMTKTNQVAVPSIEQPVPIRTQAKVMRIWVGPWEDDDGDLHADGFVYTEIEGRKWNLGNRFVSPGSALSPLSQRTPMMTVPAQAQAKE